MDEVKIFTEEEKIKLKRKISHPKTRKSINQTNVKLMEDLEKEISKNKGTENK